MSRLNRWLMLVLLVALAVPQIVAAQAAQGSGVGGSVPPPQRVAPPAPPAPPAVGYGVGGAIAGSIGEPQGRSPRSPEDEMKLAALNGLRNASPEQGVPVLDKFLQGNDSLELKVRALSVLASYDTSAAMAVVAKFARTASDPALQVRAVQYLGRFESTQARKELVEIYGSTSSVEVKRAVIRALSSADDVPALMQLTRAEAAEELRGAIVRELGRQGAVEELRGLYKTESSVEVRAQILRGLQAADDYSTLATVAGNEAVVSLRAEAIRRLSTADTAESGKTLQELYAKEQSTDLRKEILRGLARQDNVTVLIQIARSEKDPDLKKLAVSYIARSKSKEATDFMMEILNK